MFDPAPSRYPPSNLKTLSKSNADRSFVLVMSAISNAGEDYGRAFASCAPQKISHGGHRVARWTLGEIVSCRRGHSEKSSQRPRKPALECYREHGAAGGNSSSRRGTTPVPHGLKGVCRPTSAAAKNCCR